MTNPDVESFRLSWKWLLIDGFLIAAFSWATIAMLGADLVAVATGAALFVFLFGALTLGFVVRVHGAGIDYGLFYRLYWKDVSSARFRNFVGLPYLFIERKQAPGWWLPLYLKGKRPLLESLADNAPEESPIRKLLDDR